MLSKGQKDDFLGYMATGSMALWALGGLPGLLTATVISACGIGAMANQTPPADSVPTIDEQVEKQLRTKYGDDAVAAYRRNLAHGMFPQIAARGAIFEELQKR